MYLVIAAITTTKIALNAALVTLAKYESMQDRLYNEIITFTKSNNGIYELKSLSKLNYLRAVVHEILRYAASTFNIPRVVLHSDVKLGGYNVPKGAVVIDAYRKFSFDSKLWKDVSTFNPMNHLDENGLFKKQKAFCGFGMGKRDCPGQSLALRALYLLIGKLLIRYQFKLTPQGLNQISKVEADYDRELKDYDKIAVKIQKRS